MADSLDDFFAKKDKKRKNKNQTSALSAEAFVRELEVRSKQNEYSSRRDGHTSTALELLGLDANDNDWKDFEEIEKRDYTGLKVKEMSIQDQEEEQRRLNEQVEQAPESKPWKAKEETVELPPPPPPIQPPEKVVGDVKVLEPVRLSKLKGPKSSNQAIDIKDEKSFPSLG